MSVTLYANDSINLTTGVVTRDNSFDMRTHGMGEIEALLNCGSVSERLSRNDLDAFAEVLRSGS